MKKILALTCLSLFLAATSAMATPSTLSDILGSGYGTYTDTGAEAVALTDTDGVDDSATAFLILEVAGWADGNVLGMYDFSYDSAGNVVKGNELDIFAGTASSLTSVTLEWDTTLSTVTNKITNVSADIDGTFGFYLKNDNQNIQWFSHTELNTDGQDHMMLFDTSDDIIGSLLGSQVVLAWDDQPGTSADRDFNDMVVGVTDVAPVPEPATLFLLGFGLLGFAGLRRKNAKN